MGTFGNTRTFIMWSSWIIWNGLKSCYICHDDRPVPVSGGSGKALEPLLEVVWWWWWRWWHGSIGRKKMQLILLVFLFDLGHANFFLLLVWILNYLRLATFTTITTCLVHYYWCWYGSAKPKETITIQLPPNRPNQLFFEEDNNNVGRSVGRFFKAFFTENVASNRYKHVCMYAHKCQGMFPLLILSSA